MIVKLWPIKGQQGASQCLLYIDDDEKVLQVQVDENQRVVETREIDTAKEFGLDSDTYFIDNEDDVRRVLQYMANEDKTKHKYVSGYMCRAETALEAFETVWASAVNNGDETAQFSDNEALSFHMVQSFPEDLDISDEEVHQCGIELLQKIEKHQGVVCSHVHPVVDDEGEVHGKCKHNHILFNAYMHPSKLDPEHPERHKYHSCAETYRQMQIWNDEIAIEHGLPIIQEPDLMRSRSWKEAAEGTYGRSWKQFVRWDVDFARRESSNWEEFVEKMEKAGYTLRGQKTLTYISPYEGNKRIRATTLGQEYTKESLELFWALRDRLDVELLAALKEEKAPVLYALSLQHDGPLTVDVPLGIAGKEANKYYPLPLVKANRSREVLSSYFNSKELYDVRDASGAFISKATGEEIVFYLDALRRDEEERFRRLYEEEKEKEQARLRDEAWAAAKDEEEEKRRKQQDADEKTREQHRYYISQFKNTRTGEPYKTYLYDQDGRRRSSLDLMFMLAITIITNEAGLWDVPEPPPEKRNEPIFGPPNWKAEAILEAMHTAEDEGVSTLYEINSRLDQLGAEYSRARKTVEKTERALENMKKVANALDDYEDTHEFVERIEAMPESDEKEQRMKQYSQDIAKCRSAKSTLYANKIMTNNGLNMEAVFDFRWRREDMEKNLPQMRQRLDEAKEAYRRMKKLQYHTQLAESAFFCYGPAYSKERAEQRRERGERATEKEFDNFSRDN